MYNLYNFERFLSEQFRYQKTLNFLSKKNVEKPTQKFKNEFSYFSSQEIGSSFVSFEMIFQALQS